MIVRVTVLVTGCDAEMGAVIVIVVVAVCVLELVTVPVCVELPLVDAVSLNDWVALVLEVVVLLLIMDLVAVHECRIVEES